MFFKTWVFSGWETFGEAQRGMRESRLLRLYCGKTKNLHREGKNEERKLQRAAVARRGHLRGLRSRSEANDTSQAFRHNWRREGYVVICLPCCIRCCPSRPESQRNIASLGMNTLWCVCDLVRQNETGMHHPRVGLEWQIELFTVMTIFAIFE